MKKLLSLALALMACATSFTSCMSDGDTVAPTPFWPSNDTVMAVKVMTNPRNLAVVGNKLCIRGYGTFDYSNLTYPLQVVNPATLEVTTIANARNTSFCAASNRLLMVDSYTEDYVTYTTTFRYYNAADGEVYGEYLGGVPEELYKTNVYAVLVNPNNQHIYIVATDYFSQSTIYHFNALGYYADTITGFGPSVSSAAFDGETAYFVSEGNWQSNNSTIYRVRLGETTATDFYAAANGGKTMGDVGLDILMAADKSFYVVVNNSSYVTHLDANGKELQRYACTEADGQPRFIAALGDHFYVSTYGGKVLKLDAQMNKVGELKLGPSLEQIVALQDRLCVLGWEMGADNYMYVINPAKAFAK